MTNILSVQRVLLALGIIVFVGAAVVSATGAFFNDTETSTGNTFAAGAIDLKIDNESYAIDFNIPTFEGTPTGALVASPTNSWTLDELTGKLFFNFTDLKPGDYGEDTISIHVNDNDAWLCAAARVTADNDASYTEPEEDDDLTVDLQNPTTTDGELAENLEFAFWADDGDNVLETDEVDNIFVNGTAAQLNTQGQIALTDSTVNQWGAAGTPIAPNQTLYIGKAWCFGDLQAAALAQDTLTNDGPIDDADIQGADRLGAGVTCNGASSLNNAAQTDVVQGDLEFFAVQSRNNTGFSCAQGYRPSWAPVN